MINTAIAIFCFNRPSQTKKVFNQIKKIKPNKIFLIMDGPRKKNKLDKINCNKVKKIITSINWNCKVYKNFNKSNEGLKKRFITGLTWVFSKVDKAIILEDDCLPSNDFFYFCDQLLKYYQNSKKVKFITGNCFQKKNMKIKETYYFSKYSHIWGWAAWRSTWKLYNDNEKYWKKYLNSKKFQKVCEDQNERKYWSNMFENIQNGKLKSWAFYMLLSLWKNNLLTATPSINLVENVGFNAFGTNTKKLNINSKLSDNYIDRPIKHPKKIMLNKEADKFVFKNIYSSNLKKKLFNKLISIFKSND